MAAIVESAFPVECLWRTRFACGKKWKSENEKRRLRQKMFERRGNLGIPRAFQLKTGRVGR